MNDDLQKKGADLMRSWVADWCKFAREALGVNLDKEQEEILRSVQFNPRTSVASGTARGKDFVTAVAAICFLYLTPKWNKNGEMIENTKVALTAPTGRQVENIMIPEISRLFNRAKKKGIILPGRLVSNDIRTDNEEWFLTGFKADEHNHESWSGFHAVNTMFAITEATGIVDDTFGAIEGNLQGNSRILLVFNPNKTTGYAAKTFKKKDKWKTFNLNNLNAPNVLAKKIIIPGQVDYEWVKNYISDPDWCTPISKDDVLVDFDDFEFEGKWYRPEDICRKKILGKFPKVDEDVLIPPQWVELAQERWKLAVSSMIDRTTQVIGVDVAGMGRDCTVFCDRFDNYVKSFDKHNSGGKADHMKVTGQLKSRLDANKHAVASIDTIGEGAGVYSRLVEQGLEGRTISCKFSESAKNESGDDRTDITGQYKFANMRAYLFWAVRDWLDPKNNTGAMLPLGNSFAEEASEIKWSFRSDGKIAIEPKDDIKKRLGRSIDEFDALANTFYPFRKKKAQDLRGVFF